MATHITLTGRAAAYRGDPETEITSPEALGALDGLRYEADVCSRYLYDPLLEELGIADGTVGVRFDSDAGELRVVTEYTSPRKLNEKELDALAEETRGQWGDGIGESAFDDYAQKTGIRIDLSPFDRDQDLRVEQTAIAGPPPKKPSPLFSSARSGNLKRLAKLLDAGEDPNVISKDGFTPLAFALWQGHTEAARLLIERGTHVNGHDPKEFCPLTHAVIRGNPEIVRLLLEKGADVNGRMTPDQEKVDYAPLTMACNRKQWECGRILLEHGADPNIPDKNDYTPLLMLKDDEESLEFARLLIAAGADVNAHNEFYKVGARFKALAK